MLTDKQTYPKSLAHLQALEKRGALDQGQHLYLELITMQVGVNVKTSVCRNDTTLSTGRERLKKSLPLLSFEDFSPNWQQVQMLFEQIVAWTGKDSKAPPGESQSLRKISRNIPLLTRLTEAWYLQHSLKDMATTEGVDCELLSSVIAATLKPFLVAYAQLLLPEVDQELWRRRYCPICGGKPDFAYLDKQKGARWLVCFRCDAEWLFQRLECPYCGTQNQAALSYFANEEAYLYRLYVCEQCRTYIKAIDLRRTDSEVLLPLERIMTLDMDRQAQEKGYKPGWISSTI